MDTSAFTEEAYLQGKARGLLMFVTSSSLWDLLAYQSACWTRMCICRLRLNDALQDQGIYWRSTTQFLTRLSMDTGVVEYDANSSESFQQSCKQRMKFAMSSALVFLR